MHVYARHTTLSEGDCCTFHCTSLHQQNTDLPAQESHHGMLQVGAIDFQAMTLALATLLALPLPKLTRHKPPGYICRRPVLLLMVVMALCLYACIIWNMIFMIYQPWYHGGTGTHAQVQITLHDRVNVC